MFCCRSTLTLPYYILHVGLVFVYVFRAWMCLCLSGRSVVHLAKSLRTTSVCLVGSRARLSRSKSKVPYSTGTRWQGTLASPTSTIRLKRTRYSVTPITHQWKEVAGNCCLDLSSLLWHFSCYKKCFESTSMRVILIWKRHSQFGPVRYARLAVGHPKKNTTSPRGTLPHTSWSRGNSQLWSWRIE